MVGYILSQEGDDGKRYPNHFGSIRLFNVESRYSQAKLELYRLFRALRAVHIFVFGVNNFTVEMDAKYIQGMINNPDLQPNATINRWIMGILLFSFRLVHILATHHTGADGLSCCPPSDEDPPEEDDFEDWLDNSYSFLITLLNDRIAPYGGFTHLSRLLPSPLSENCPVQLALYDDALPTHLDTSCVAPVLVITDSDSHHDNPIIPRTAKAHAKDDWIDRICNFLHDHVRPPDLLDSDYTSFVNAATCFFLLTRLLYCREQHGQHQLVVPVECRYGLIQEAHDSLGHKGVFSVRTCLLLHFWWPVLVDDVKWYIHTCHECQIRQTARLHIPPTIPVVGGLFHKVHINTMVMPRSGGYRYIVQARGALTAYLEWCMLQSETASVIVSFLFKDILRCWGAVSELITDNGPAFVQALDVLASWYGIRHIWISPYNSQVNGVVEQRHYNVREAIVKSTLGGEIRWSVTAHSVFWAECVTILKSTGLSPYFMVHGVEPLFPFDLSEATFLVPVPDTDHITTPTLIAWRAHQLQKRWEDIDTIREQVLLSQFASLRHFKQQFKNWIRQQDFSPGDLVLVHKFNLATVTWYP